VYRYQVDRFKIKAALDWLCQNNPSYYEYAIKERDADGREVTVCNFDMGHMEAWETPVTAWPPNESETEVANGRLNPKRIPTKKSAANVSGRSHEMGASHSHDGVQPMECDSETAVIVDAPVEPGVMSEVNVLSDEAFVDPSQIAALFHVPSEMRLSNTGNMPFVFDSRLSSDQDSADITQVSEGYEPREPCSEDIDVRSADITQVSMGYEDADTSNEHCDSTPRDLDPMLNDDDGDDSVMQHLVDLGDQETDEMEEITMDMRRKYRATVEEDFPDNHGIVNPWDVDDYWEGAYPHLLCYG
jgi:hypothetical protein